MHDALFQPLTMGALEAKNRVFMAPLTRGRAAEPMFVPNEMMGTYYKQRAGAGMILTEATGISTEGLGWPSAPGIWSDEQTEAWKPIVRGVQDAGGMIVLQLWHMGRIVHPYFLDGQPPFSASATKAPGEAHTPIGKQEYVTAREMTKEDIDRTVADYRRAAENAKKAGFDGVQLHGANGYLVDQFLRDGTNHRTDEYGGSPENRTRFMREVLEAIIDVWGADRVGIRLSPNGDSQGTDDSNPEATFGAAAKVCENTKPAQRSNSAPACRRASQRPGQRREARACQTGSAIRRYSRRRSDASQPSTRTVLARPRCYATRCASSCGTKTAAWAAMSARSLVSPTHGGTEATASSMSVRTRSRVLRAPSSATALGRL